MEQLDKTGIKAMVGKVNMDRNGSPQLQEESAQASADATVQWIKDTLDKFENVKPILTPRFTPSCSDELMEKLSEIQKRYHLPMQSHLSENFGEIAWVKELCPNTHFYGEAYSQFGLFGGDCPTIMAHCVHSSDEEIALMKSRAFILLIVRSLTQISPQVSLLRDVIWTKAYTSDWDLTLQVELPFLFCVPWLMLFRFPSCTGGWLILP